MPGSLDAIVAMVAGLGARMEAISAEHEPTDDLNEVAAALYTLTQCMVDLGRWVDDLDTRVSALPNV